MAAGTSAVDLLDQETQALLTRLERVKSFALHETMLPAAALSTVAQVAIERALSVGRARLRVRAEGFLDWLAGDGRAASAAEVQRRYTLIRLEFNDVLSQFDTFAEVITQRSEHEIGVELSGLDVVATDALALPGYYQAPPVVCYLARGPGAAIRRARTRLPGGDENPVAIIRVPRERMIGYGIASSLVHEVGHQAAAMLDLVASLQSAIDELLADTAGEERQAWQSWRRWISEIVADFWSVSRLGIGSTLGLMSVVSLPRYFVFRPSGDDPHPVPWVRVALSCAMGDELWPHPQWQAIADLWEQLYPAAGLAEGWYNQLGALQATAPDLAHLIAAHRPAALRGRTLAEISQLVDRTPERLQSAWQLWHRDPKALTTVAPTLAFAVIGNARAAGHLNPADEGRLLHDLLTHWALRSTLDLSAQCADLTRELARRRAS